MPLIRITADLHAHVPAMEMLLAEAGDYALTLVAGDLMDMFALEAGLQRQREFIFDWMRDMVRNGHWLAWCDGNHDHGLRVPDDPHIISPGQTQIIGNLAVVTSLPWEGANWDRPSLKKARQLRETSALPWIVLSHRPPPQTSPESANFEEDAHVEAFLSDYAPDFYCCGHAHEAPYRHGDCLWKQGHTKIINPGRREEGINSVRLNPASGAMVWDC